MTRFSDRTRIVSEEAAYWYLRCSDERVMALVDRREFFAWLKRSPENIAELLRVSGLDGRLARKKLIATVTALDESNVIDLGMQSGALQQHRQSHDSPYHEHKENMAHNNSRVWRIAAIAAVVSLVFLLAVVANTDVADGTVKTGASQWQHITLDDGSVVHVDARTEIKVEFSAHQRVVHLLAGRALFEVAKNPKRPFIVSTDVIDAIAVGTKFSVSLDQGVATTIVSEGLVRVTPHGQRDGKNSVLLRASQELQVSGSGLTKQSSAAVARVDVDRKLAWARGWLVFKGETIGQAASEFNRRNAMQIKIDQRAIAERRLRGYYRLRVDSPEMFARLIDAEDGIAIIVDRPNNVVHLQLE